MGTGRGAGFAVGACNGSGGKIDPGRGGFEHLADLMQAEQVASNLVAAAGGGQVTNSWGSSEFSGETAYDSNFTHSGSRVFCVVWRLSGPFVSVVVAQRRVGGRNYDFTQIRDHVNYLYETPWQSAGGGISAIEPRPHYQNAIQSIVGNKRGTPDFSFDANPETGVWVHTTTPVGGSTGWFIVGGTSVSLAGPGWHRERVGEEVDFDRCGTDAGLRRDWQCHILQRHYERHLRSLCRLRHEHWMGFLHGHGQPKGSWENSGNYSVPIEPRSRAGLFFTCSIRLVRGATARARILC